METNNIQIGVGAILDNNRLHIYDLNNDCIYEIMRRLSVRDVLELLGVFNERFDEIIKQRLALEKHFRYCLRDEYKYKYSHLLLIGKYLKSIYLSAGYSIRTEKILCLLYPLVQNPQFLTSLELHFIEFNIQYVKCINAAGECLEELNLDFCRLRDNMLVAILEKCRNLTKLSIIGNYDLSGTSLVNLNVKKLQALTLEENDRWFFNVEEFAKNNPHIKVTLFSQYRVTKTEFNNSFSYSCF
ncbi:uncharacterized protein LOC119690068 [Teleopsis dalmanni]|uniref:uncharacterized protein LOC119690068 n=1 Tax=Teleopsis dalmanni TaxID=139649 RepID=UPI0018CCEEAF|nr:uncharacterized protein LOC119690068 [Teleopsis dalmanni]